MLINRFISTASIHISCQSACFFLQHVGVNKSNPVSLHRCVSEAVPAVTRVFSVECVEKFFTNPEPVLIRLKFIRSVWIQCDY